MKSLNELFIKYRASVYRICLRYTRDKDAAEDLSQNIFIKVMENLKQFEGKSDPFTWIYRITVNECLHYLRRKTKETNLEDWTEHETLKIEGVDRAVETKIILQEIMSLFDSRTREIVFMAYFEGLQQDEMAKALGISERAINKRLAAFRERMIKIKLKMEHEVKQ
ncbi:MAG: RNA polymerase sigma factor [Fibrobacteres bacterium]|nr:RNA polymerase sigma factor [Fibrobacterota bacterium]